MRSGRAAVTIGGCVQLLQPQSPAIAGAGDARIQRQAMKMMWTATTMMITTSVRLCLCFCLFMSLFLYLSVSFMSLHLSVPPSRFVRLFVCSACLINRLFVSVPVFVSFVVALSVFVSKSFVLLSVYLSSICLSVCVLVHVRIFVCPDVPRKPFSITKDSPFPYPAPPLAYDLSLSGRGRSLSP